MGGKEKSQKSKGTKLVTARPACLPRCRGQSIPGPADHVPSLFNISQEAKRCEE